MATAEAGTEPEGGADRAVACATRALAKCSLVDCDNPRPETPAPADPAGVGSGSMSVLCFCSPEHAEEAKQRRILPVREVGVELAFQVRTVHLFHPNQKGDGWTMSMLSAAHPKYQSVENQFYTSWKKLKYDPCLERIFRLELSNEIIFRYRKYAGRVGNERRRFHGTSSRCSVGITLDRGPCCDPQCKVCSICMSGFDTRRAGDNTGFLRYGQAIYFSSVAAKANDYARGSERVINGRRHRAIFLCLVAAGRTYHTTKRRLNLNGPPEGYDSVVGEVGEVLNYDEIVLYNHAGALPRYLVVYTIDDNPAYVDPNTEGELNGQAEDDILENGPGEGEFDGQAEDDILENGPGEGGALVSAVRDRKEDSAPSQP